MDSASVFIMPRDESVSSSGCSKGQKPSCCCRYDPSEDDSPELRIRDLPFALKKLSVMKCQMRKWQLERLQMESQTRSLRIALQSYGVDMDEAVKTDPLITHFHSENLRLQRLKDGLEDQVRDLKESLKERDCGDNNSSDTTAHLREKISKIRQEHTTEKKQLRETIANLQLRLQEAKDESSCAALNRLRAKLRELMKGGKKGDQQVSCALEKSIETLVELSKSCDELRKENERLLTEVETLKKDPKESAVEEKLIKEDELEKDLEPKEISNLYGRIKTYERLANEMRLQLTEKDDMINDLQKKLFSERLSKAEAEATNNKLNHNDEKNTKEVKNNQNSSLEKENDESTNQLKALKERLEKVRKELREEKYVNESWKKEVENLRRQNEELQAAGDCPEQDGMATLKAKMDSLCADNAKLAAELESFRTECSELNKCANKLGAEIDVLTKEKAGLMHALECARHNDETSNKELEVSRQRVSELLSSLANVSGDKDRLEREVGDFKWQLNKLKKDLEVQLAVKNELRQKYESASTVLSSFTSTSTLITELSEIKKDKQTLEESKNILSAELTSCKTKMKMMSSENKQLKSDIEKLRLNLDQLKGKFNGALKQSTTMKHEIKKLQSINSDLYKLESKRNESDKESNKAKSDRDNHINDLMSASKTLKDKMQMQIRAMDCIRTFIGYAEGSVTKKPEISSELSACEYDRIDWLIPQINQLFETSQELSETILKAEQEVRYLADLRQKDRRENQGIARGGYNIFNTEKLRFNEESLLM